MSISLYFGLPRSGKTTFYAKIALDECKKISKNKSNYDFVCGNIPLNLGKYAEYYKQIKFEYLGKYDIRNALVLIDEASLCVDNRDYKTFSSDTKQFFLLHGHYKCDIVFFNQQWDALDKKIRVITNEVYYVRKTAVLGRWLSLAHHIPYGIIIPDGKDDGEKLGEIVQGYCKPPFLEWVFASRKCWRPFYYKIFDSWDAPVLAPLPEVSTEA